MWRITAEGQRRLQRLAKEAGGRSAFGLQVGIGKNQVKPLLEDRDHSINNNTLQKLRDFCDEFCEGTHYEGAGDESFGVALRLARDRVPAKNLSRHAQKGIERLYEALFRNPEFRRLRPALDTPAEFHKWFSVWRGASEDMPSEQFFVYRVFRDKVISFLFGERHIKSPENPVEIFALWYLVGTSNAFYDDSPVGLDADDEKLLPLGEREAAADLAKRLLDELREQRSVSYLIFEVEAEELMRPDSYGRLLFRIYSRAEEDVRRHFVGDSYLRDARFFVLGFPYQVPRQGKEPSEFTLVEHRLVCCPLFPYLRDPFLKGSVPVGIVQKILTSVYRMYWNYYDADSPERQAICAVTEEAEEHFLEWEKTGLVTACTLRDYINKGFVEMTGMR